MSSDNQTSAPYFDAGPSAFKPSSPPNNTLYRSTDLNITERFFDGVWTKVEERAPREEK